MWCKMERGAKVKKRKTKEGNKGLVCVCVCVYIYNIHNVLKCDKFQWLLLAVYTGATCMEAVLKTKAGLSYGILLKV
jgi:hypothetical protein